MQRTLSIALVVCVITLAGCSKNNPPTAPQTNGGGTTGTPVSPTRRQSALQAVDQAFAATDWSDPAAAKQQLLQFLQGRGEFEASGANDDNSLWARFTDGRVLIILNNRPADDTSATLPPVLPSHVDINGGELPKNQTATVMSSMGNVFTYTPAVIVPMFKAKGYNATKLDATIANLKTVSGCGAFYVTAHGGDAVLRGGSVEFGLWTSTPFDTVTDASLKALWDNGELCYISATTNKLPGQPGDYVHEEHFGITAKFVTNEMSFGQNSLIYIDACHSADPDFAAACIAKSAGISAAYAGWTNSVGDFKATSAAYFFIDRLLGTNMDPRHRENPPQRPFTYPQILAELSSDNLDTYVDPTDKTVANFTIQPPDAVFGMFAPSIEDMEVDERNHQLRIDGLFGSDLGGAMVTLNDQQVTITDRSPGELLCTLDTKTQNTGGDVKVIIHGDTSNVVRLTEWKGEIQTQITLPGSVSMTITFSFHIRADMHSFRTEPGTTPMPEVVEPIDGMPDSYAHYVAGGTATDVVTNGCTWKYIETWEHAEDSLHYPSPPPKGLTIEGEVRPQDKTLTLYVGINVFNAVTDDYTDSLFCPDEPPGGGTVTAPFPISELDTFRFSIDNNFNLIARGGGEITHPCEMLEIYDVDPNYPPGTVTVTAGGISVNYPPDPKAGQRPALRHDRWAQSSGRSVVARPGKIGTRR